MDAATPPRKLGRPLSFDRDAALHQAMLAFWRNGYETTSISDLTAAMQVTAPSIYTAFGDKKRLFLEAMHLYAGSPDALQRSLDEALSAREAVRGMLLGAAVAFTGDDTPRGCLLASATAAGSPGSAEVQRAVAEVRAAITARLEARIARDILAGLQPETPTAATLAALVVATIQGLSTLARDGMDRGSLTAVADAALRAWP